MEGVTGPSRLPPQGPGDFWANGWEGLKTALESKDVRLWSNL